MQRLGLRDLRAGRIRGAVARRRHRWELLSRLPRNGVGAEIGTWEGDFASRLLRRASPRRLYLIDPWEHRTETTYERAFFGQRRAGGQAEMDAIHEGVLARFERQISAGQVVIVRERSTAAAPHLEEPLDWAYIDGDHTYEAVKSDLESFYHLLKPGGVMAGDDYLVRGWWDDGVTRAVDEFVETHGLAQTVLGNQFLFTKTS